MDLWLASNDSLSTSCLMKTKSGIFNRLKQAKDPCVIRILNQYIKFPAKMAVAQTHIQFLDKCIE